ncbi:MAG: DNA-directed RNA polymerase subunit RpoH/Rpb5 C-terminal domain-containing protein [archaeon]
MHILQPKHSKISEKEAKELLNKLNISISQIPKIKEEDPTLPEGCKPGDLIKIERGDKVYYRVVV